jgi:molybdopterin-guanine dinucleotide biosynthesis protein A
MKARREAKVESQEFSAVILAGGKSSRMGRDKAWLKMGGTTLLARQIELVRALGAREVFISGRADQDYGPFGCRVLVDRFQNAGPLAGLESALAANSSPLLLVLAVDMPAMCGGLLEKLRTACAEGCGAIPEVNGRIEPLAAFYPKAAWTVAIALLEEARARSEKDTPGPTDLARRCVAENMMKLILVSAAEARYFTNVNSPEELRQYASKGR